MYLNIKGEKQKNVFMKYREVNQFQSKITQIKITDT